ncbi:hypothetical protein EIN_108570 [Entamoeba invadens IP1]|uniref:EGF-like domain-containing protein n=1 Tax=Entamoeba invadens IP1 TaxID=370355 RepID=L7FQP6_ENTIV|nr:hypothetical protein EIN_108570 [Entamoeba invadens IP1]ELP94695.1 hypothetical protein EIN_108570 [Entamoeba invadens IP1]|eukprot:XP_004261466.1 hypothetical protein EIN_108570 [Entamoeba invadens IP1]
MLNFVVIITLVVSANSLKCGNSDEDINCVACSIDASKLDNCVDCIEGFYLDLNNEPNNCIACPSNCSYCNELKCITCNTKFNFTESNVCVSCGNQCDTCEYSNNDKTMLCTSCESGYYLYNNTCNKCSLTGCVECEYIESISDVGCTYCDDSNLVDKFVNVDTHQCETCEEGKLFGNYCDHNISSCEIDNCVFCEQNSTGNNECLRCNTSLYLLQNNTCGPCDGPTDFKYFYTSNYIKYYVCGTCDPNYHCNGCSTNSWGTQICDKCEENYYMDPSDHRCNDCSKGYFNNNQCEYSYYYCNTIISNCVGCRSENESIICTHCYDSYYLNKTDLTCSNCNIGKRYTENNGVYSISYCGECDPVNNCVGCEVNENGEEYCIKCDKGYYIEINGTKCIDCSAGKIIDNKYCDTTPNVCEDEIDNCVRCNKTYYGLDCLQCKGNRVISLLNGCEDCNKGKKVDEHTCSYCSVHRKCSLCHDEINITTNEKNEICDNCTDGYYPNNETGCYIYICNVPFCSTCKTNKECYLCESGYILNDNNECKKIGEDDNNADNHENASETLWVTIVLLFIWAFLL